jgi:hypothetical protein
MFVPFAEMKIAPFKCYEDIPQLTKEYIVYVSGEKELEKVPLTEINGFMEMLYTSSFVVGKSMRMVG